MAHTAIHFSAGIVFGASVTLPLLLRAWRAGKRLSAPLGRCLLAAYAAGVLAVLPAAAARITGAELDRSAWWLHLFVAYPLIDRLAPGGTLAGPVILAACLGVQYACLLAAIRRVHRPPSPDAPTRP